MTDCRVCVDAGVCKMRTLITAKDKETALAACRQVLKNNGRLA